MKTLRNPRKMTLKGFIGLSNRLRKKLEKCFALDPVVLFLLGYNYRKFEDDCGSSRFEEFVESVKESMDTRIMSNAELEQTYSTLYNQSSLSEVFKLDCLKNHKTTFQDTAKDLPNLTKTLLSTPSPGQETQKKANFELEPLPKFLTLPTLPPAPATPTSSSSTSPLPHAQTTQNPLPRPRRPPPGPFPPKSLMKRPRISSKDSA
ncbi:unnamed protein product [Moneuplotes crassus]|uniref:Uncharacterized protein n=1 Tax=Euplotes crassus TaxID=5936 RepID=A0AAD1XQB2_EUPCR|nr:unnamed protein product [Moneuplotes crassus]